MNAKRNKTHINYSRKSQAIPSYKRHNVIDNSIYKHVKHGEGIIDELEYFFTQTIPKTAKRIFGGDAVVYPGQTISNSFKGSVVSGGNYYTDVASTISPGIFRKLSENVDNRIGKEALLYASKYAPHIFSMIGNFIDNKKSKSSRTTKYPMSMYNIAQQQQHLALPYNPTRAITHNPTRAIEYKPHKNLSTLTIEELPEGSGNTTKKKNTKNNAFNEFYKKKKTMKGKGFQYD